MLDFIDRYERNMKVCFENVDFLKFRWGNFYLFMQRYCWGKILKFIFGNYVMFVLCYCRKDLFYCQFNYFENWD